MGDKLGFCYAVGTYRILVAVCECISRYRDALSGRIFDSRRKVSGIEEIDGVSVSVLNAEYFSRGGKVV